jgi:hypothetical protein
MSMRDQKYFEHCITYAVLLGADIDYVVDMHRPQWGWRWRCREHGKEWLHKTRGAAAEAFLARRGYRVGRKRGTKGQLVKIVHWDYPRQCFKELR